MTRFCAFGDRGGRILDSPPVANSLISAAVGFGGVNLRNDVLIVQTLLNLVAAAFGGPAIRLKVDGIIGPLTIGAIRRVQSTNLGFNDGRSILWAKPWRA